MNPFMKETPGESGVCAGNDVRYTPFFYQLLPSGAQLTFEEGRGHMFKKGAFRVFGKEPQKDLENWAPKTPICVKRACPTLFVAYGRLPLKILAVLCMKSKGMGIFSHLRMSMLMRC